MLVEYWEHCFEVSVVEVTRDDKHCIRIPALLTANATIEKSKSYVRIIVW